MLFMLCLSQTTMALLNGGWRESRSWKDGMKITRKQSLQRAYLPILAPETLPDPFKMPFNNDHSIHGTVETVAITYEAPSCAPGLLCAPPPQYWLAVGTVTLQPRPTPTPNPSPDSKPLIYVFSQGQYFVGAFLPTLIAVLFSLPWHIIDAKVRSLEPFHQLSKDRGARANTSLCMDYISPVAPIVPMKALLAGHWAPLMTSLLSITTILIIPLAPEFFSIRMQGSCDFQTAGCVPSLSIFPAAGRAIEALLCLIAALHILLIIHLHRYSTGVFAEPSSIAGIATLFNNAEVVEDFRSLPSTTSKASMFKSLRKRKYKLDFHADRDGSQRYGIVPLAPSIRITVDAKGTAHAIHRKPVPNVSEEAMAFAHPHWRGALGLMLLLSGLVVIIIYYKLTDSSTSFERFMDSQGFGVRFLFTLIGVGVKLYWELIFKSMVHLTTIFFHNWHPLELAILEPYKSLAKRTSTANDSILIRRHSSPITTFASALTRRHFLVASVALSVFLSDALTICLSNIHFKNGTTFTAFTVATWLSCSIIAVMLITLLGVAFCSQPDLPLRPTTIAGVLCYLSHSSIPGRVDNMATLKEGVRNRMVRDLDLKYGMWAQNDLLTIEVDTPVHYA